MPYSELDPYSNMTYIIFDYNKNTGFCLDNGWYFGQTSFSKTIDEVESLIEKIEDQASEAIMAGDIDILAETEKHSRNTDGIIAKMDLYLIQYKNN